MAVYVNTSGQTRTWLALTNPATGRTLELDPGEEVELDAELSDPHLKQAAKKTASKKAPQPYLKPIEGEE